MSFPEFMDALCLLAMAIFSNARHQGKYSQPSDQINQLFQCMSLRPNLQENKPTIAAGLSPFAEWWNLLDAARAPADAKRPDDYLSLQPLHITALTGCPSQVRCSLLAAVDASNRGNSDATLAHFEHARKSWLQTVPACAADAAAVATKLLGTLPADLEVYFLVAVGTVLEGDGEVQAALQRYQAAQTMLRGQQSRWQEIKIVLQMALGSACFHLGQHVQAFKHLVQAYVQCTTALPSDGCMAPTRSLSTELESAQSLLPDQGNAHSGARTAFRLHVNAGGYVTVTLGVSDQQAAVALDDAAMLPAVAMHNLACACDALRHGRDALKLIQDAHRLLCVQLGPSHPRTMLAERNIRRILSRVDMRPHAGKYTGAPPAVPASIPAFGITDKIQASGPAQKQSGRLHAVTSIRPRQQRPAGTCRAADINAKVASTGAQSTPSQPTPARPDKVYMSLPGTESSQRQEALGCAPCLVK
jgi:hypothetical protein